MRQWAELAPLMRVAVDAGLHGVAVLSPSGEPVGVHGAFESYEVRALAALVSKNGPPDLLKKLFDGELATTTFEHRTVILGIAARCVFVIAVAAENLAMWRAAAEALRHEVGLLIQHSRVRHGNDWVPPTDGSSGSGSAPAEAFVWPRDPKRLPS